MCLSDGAGDTGTVRTAVGGSGSWLCAAGGSRVLVEQALGHGDTSGESLPLCPALTGILSPTPL